MVRRSNRVGPPAARHAQGTHRCGEDVIQNSAVAVCSRFSVLILGAAVASTVSACADSDEFDFKPRGTKTPIAQGG